MRKSLQPSPAQLNGSQMDVLAADFRIQVVPHTEPILIVHNWSKVLVFFFFFGKCERNLLLLSFFFVFSNHNPCSLWWCSHRRQLASLSFHLDSEMKGEDERKKKKTFAAGNLWFFTKFKWASTILIGNGVVVLMSM
jgi:hypothetical protein